MTNEIATNSNLPTSPDEITAGLANMQAVGRASGGDTDSNFMKFSKGEFLFGSESIEVEEGSQWAINPASFRHGFQCWGKSGTPSDGDLLGEETASMFESAMLKKDLPHFEDGRWADLIGFTLTCVSGEDEGTQCYLSGTSVGFVREAKVLVSSVLAQSQKDNTKPVAIVELHASNYKHKKYGKIYTPVFKVKGFESLNATAVTEAVIEEPEVEVEVVAKKAPKRRRHHSA
jgi:hypothetical protein